MKTTANTERKTKCNKNACGCGKYIRKNWNYCPNCGKKRGTE